MYCNSSRTKIQINFLEPTSSIYSSSPPFCSKTPWFPFSLSPLHFIPFSTDLIPHHAPRTHPSLHSNTLIKLIARPSVYCSLIFPDQTHQQHWTQLDCSLLLQILPAPGLQDLSLSSFSSSWLSSSFCGFSSICWFLTIRIPQASEPSYSRSTLPRWCHLVLWL